MSVQSSPLSREKIDAMAMARAEKLFASDPELVAMFIDQELSEVANSPDLPVEQSIDMILDGYSQRPALGMREYVISKDGDGRSKKQFLPAYEMTSFGELRDQVRTIASAWQNDDDIAVRRDEFILYIGFASAQQAALDIASAYCQAISAPLQSAAGTGELEAIVKNTDPIALAATMADLEVAAKLAIGHKTVRSLIAFDYDERDDEEREQLRKAQQLLTDANVGTKLVTFQELLERGRKYTWEFLPKHPDGPDRLVSLMHTSGSTGVPKGAMHDERIMKENWNATGEKAPGIQITFAPFNHGLGRYSTFMRLAVGSTVYFTLMPDMSTLFEDIRLARPTLMVFFPRVLELVYQHYQTEVSRRVRSGEDEAVADARVREEMATTFFGDRLVFATVGSAPCAPAVIEFVRQCFKIVLVNGYGNTEIGTGVAVIDGIIQKPNIIDYKLIDAPELGYYTTDLPNPRGEFTYRGQFQIKGFYRDEEATARLVDDEGFILTGDIVEELGPGHIAIIDRRKDVLKLTQGEYVAVGPLGAIFEAGSDVINQIYVYGNSQRAYLLAVVVPKFREVEKVLGENYSDQALRALIRDEMQRVSKEKNLKSFEVPRDFILETVPFSQDNGLLTSVRKRKRPALKARYGDELEAIYAAQDDAARDEMNALKDPSSPLSIEEKLTKLLEISLNVEVIDTSVPRTFSELGGDSLGAVGFSVSIEDVFDVTLPADSIVSPTGNIQKWSLEIEKLISGDDDRPTCTSIHGENARELWASDLTVAKFLGSEFVENSNNLQPLPKEDAVIVLTGANGFLGRNICLQWMERVAPKNGKVVCIIRGKNNASASERLLGVLRASGEGNAFEKRFQELAENHLEVLAGDVGEHQLGLDQATFDRLSQEADRVCHVAALVNHRMTYEHLFAPNVAGTAEVIRLAASVRRKPIDFVTSMSVLPLLKVAPGGNNEVPPSITDKLELTDAYAEGYMISKWAGELLLVNANEELGIPVNIMRGNMMLPDQKYPGQINVPDMWTRLLLSVVRTGLAPYSFYELTKDGQKMRNHYDGSPANIVAASILAAADRRHEGCQTYNMSNYQIDDGCSLDSFVDCIESAGFPITRIADYTDWLNRIEEKLRALPEDQKQQSALDVLGAFASPEVNTTTAFATVSDNYQSLVKEHLVGGVIPNLDEAYIHKCLDDMLLLGLIPNTNA